MFNLGAGEITVIVLLALIFLGPKKLPDLASGLGKLIREIRKATSDVKNEIAIDDTFRKPFEELRDAVTLHPDELKRRDQIKKVVEEAKQRAEAEEARVQAEAAAAVVPALPEPPSQGAAAPDQTLVEPALVDSPVAPPPGTVARANPTHPVVDVQEKGGSSLEGAPRVTPPVSSLDGDRANKTLTLSEADLMAGLPPSARKPTPPPLPGLDRRPPAPNRVGLPRVTPPVSSVSSERANATQILSEGDLLPPGADRPPPTPGSKKS